ncbi:MAG: hydrogenase 4 subunit B [Xanthomonadales bacterium]|jgi:formate hydrogenlyase subunit 3/multisubunit Na+/H+ antiporter MnhD subunit|nr:hydrogenase 4 subunit B [Xanthomonadales bacterium]
MASAASGLPLLVTIAIGGSLLAALVGAWADRFVRTARWLGFACLGVAGVAGVAAGLAVLMGTPGFGVELPLGLPWLRMHLRLDPLGGFFLALIGVVTVAVSLYGPRYVAYYERKPYSLGLLGVATGLFVMGMQLVVVAADAFSFMIAWELMSVSSYLLVAYEHQEPANRRAALLYLLMAQVGALLILLAFGVLSGFDGNFTFAALRARQLAEPWPTIAFALVLIGFGMKAGLVPLHVWLPEAHPAAPSHISALMSGVMLKIAVYGFIRFTFDLLGGPLWTWGVVILAVGSVTALYGVLYALMQHDLKRLLAYHSVENIGIIYIGLGLAAIFYGAGHPALGALGLVAALYHTLNHALFKSLLFLGAGVIVQRAHTGRLDQMGGLLRSMPWTGWLFLVGCISISALPPFNGFVSEWLTFQTALQATALDQGVLRAVIPVTAAMLALTGALAAACFVKVYGIAFLGRARTRRLRHAREAHPSMVAAQGLLAVLCLAFGILPGFAVSGLGRVSASLGLPAIDSATAQGWLWLTPVAPEIASYSAPLVFLGVASMFGVRFWVYLLERRRRGGVPVQRGEAWDCGFGTTGARTQYTATAFAMPIRTVFEPAFDVHEESQRETLPGLPARVAQVRYQVHVEDISWRYLYPPIERSVTAATRLVSRIQTGNLRHYLVYSFVTLVLLLWLIT